MSTRATIHFKRGTITEAIIYRHCDGYPEGLGEDLKKFLRDVEAQTSDTRFSDPAYLAAKWVVWDAGQMARNKDKPLAFLSVGIVSEDPSDIEFRYIVECFEYGAPKVRCEKV